MDLSDYRKRVHSYLVSRSYFEKLLNSGLLSIDSFKEINAKLLAKYELSERSVYNR